MSKSPRYPAPWCYPRPPAMLKVLNRNVRVEAMTAAEAEATKAIGTAKRGENIITLHPCIPYENAQDTLLHEVMHFLHADFFPGEDKVGEERVVSLFATGLTHFYQNNPAFVRWHTKPAEPQCA